MKLIEKELALHIVMSTLFVTLYAVPTILAFTVSPHFFWVYAVAFGLATVYVGISAIWGPKDDNGEKTVNGGK